MSIVVRRVRRIEMNKQLTFIIVVNRPSITKNKDEYKENIEKNEAICMCFAISIYKYFILNILLFTCFKYEIEIIAKNNF
jgi:hypothetical protein